MLGISSISLISLIWIDLSFAWLHGEKLAIFTLLAQVLLCVEGKNNSDGKQSFLSSSIAKGGNLLETC